MFFFQLSCMSRDTFANPYPGRSVIAHARPTRKRLSSRVRPGCFDATATFLRRPESAFRHDDLPTFERPARQISGSGRNGISRGVP